MRFLRWSFVVPPVSLALALVGGCGADAESQAPGAPQDDAATSLDGGTDGQIADGNVEDHAVAETGAETGTDGGSTDAPGGDTGQPDAVADAGADTGADAEGGSPGLGCITGQFTPYWGDLHAHTSFSDGEQEPKDAFAHARDVAGLDIMVVTDHLEQLYWVPPVNRWGECNGQADDNYQPGTFLADCGYEYGSGFILPLFQSTGHNNVFFPDTLFPAVQTDFHEFYASLVQCATCIGQFNHPGSEPDQTWSDWEYDAAADEKLNLFEFNGGADTWALFFVALDKGWHVSPMLNQDNHSANWGTANDKRSGLYMSELTRPAMKDAMASRRTFLTEDKNASIRMMADDVCWMGSILTGYASVALTVDANDADAGEGFASIELYGPGAALLGTFDCQGQPSCQATFPSDVAGGTYFVARAIQSDGNTLVAAPIWATP